MIDKPAKAGKDTIPGTEIFKLYDTFGFPLDFTKEIADEKSMKLDMEGFDAELEKQRERARQSWKGDEGGVSPLYQKFMETGGTQFLGIPGRAVDGPRDWHHRKWTMHWSISSKAAEATAEIVLDRNAVLCGVGRPGRRHR